MHRNDIVANIISRVAVDQLFYLVDTLLILEWVNGNNKQMLFDQVWLLICACLSIVWQWRLVTWRYPGYIKILWLGLILLPVCKSLRVVIYIHHRPEGMAVKLIALPSCPLKLSEVLKWLRWWCLLLNEDFFLDDLKGTSLLKRSHIRTAHRTFSWPLFYWQCQSVYSFSRHLILWNILSPSLEQRVLSNFCLGLQDRVLSPLFVSLPIPLHFLLFRQVFGRGVVFYLSR